MLCYRTKSGPCEMTGVEINNFGTKISREVAEKEVVNGLTAGRWRCRQRRKIGGCFYAKFDGGLRHRQVSGAGHARAVGQKQGCQRPTGGRWALPAATRPCLLKVSFG